MRVHRNTMPPQTRSGIKGHEAERLCACCVDPLPCVDSKFAAHNGNLIDHSDVDRAKSIFKQFYHFGRFCGGNTNHTFTDRAIEQFGQFTAGAGYTSHNFWSIAQCKSAITRIDSLRGVGKKEMQSCLL